MKDLDKFVIGSAIGVIGVIAATFGVGILIDKHYQQKSVDLKRASDMIDQLKDLEKSINYKKDEEV